MLLNQLCKGDWSAFGELLSLWVLVQFSDLLKLDQTHRRISGDFLNDLPINTDSPHNTNQKICDQTISFCLLD